MKIMFIGDVHGEFYLLERFVKAHSPDIVIQCGDFGYWPRHEGAFDVSGGRMSLEPLKRIECPIYFCDGNHEDHSMLRDLPEDGTIPGTKVRYMKRGTTLDLLGKTFLFMGGAMSIDKSVRTEGVDWFRNETISYSDMMSLPDKKVDVVVSHTCPTAWLKRLIGELSTYEDRDPSREALQQILDTYRPELWVHGHWHYRLSGVYKNTN